MAHPMRNHVCNKLSEVVNGQLDINFVMNIEKSIFNWCVQTTKTRPLNIQDLPTWENRMFRERYKHKFSSILFNISEPRNNLIQRIRSGDVKTKNIAGLDPGELWPTGPYKLAEQKLLNKFIISSHADGETAEDYTGIYQCMRCKSFKTTYYQLQTRSADEPMTTFVTCLNCQKRWRC
jgi:DNA-directed RNA polymerase subunit M/transcription elongation factor TFIIS